MRVMAGPAAIASTQPRLPQWQRGPSWSTQMWPTSPAEPAAPRYTSPWHTMPQPMPVPTLITRKFGKRALQAPQLAQRHQVDVVVDEDRRGVVLAQVVADREAVPGRHQRRVDQLAALEVDRARHADADADHLRARRSRSCASSSRISTRTRASTTPGPCAHVGRLRACWASTREVGPQHGHVEAGGADVDADQHAQAAVQVAGFRGGGRRRSAAGRLRPAGPARPGRRSARWPCSWRSRAVRPCHGASRRPTRRWSPAAAFRRR